MLRVKQIYAIFLKRFQHFKRSKKGFVCEVRYNTVKPVLRGHLWDKKKWPYNTGDLLKEV